jgi:hypothetical protein
MSIPGRSSFLPVADRFRLRGAANLATRVVFELGDGAQGLPHQDSGRVSSTKRVAPTPR